MARGSRQKKDKTSGEGTLRKNMTHRASPKSPRSVSTSISRQEQKTSRVIRSSLGGVTAGTSELWSKSIGQPCSFYHEGGHGQNYWARGWRYGIIRAIPIKGQKKGWIQIEIPVKLYGWNEDVSKGKIGYYVRPFEKIWVSQWNVNPPGDTTYHGPNLKEVVAERKEEKDAQQEAVNRKHRRANQLCNSRGTI